MEASNTHTDRWCSAAQQVQYRLSVNNAEGKIVVGFMSICLGILGYFIFIASGIKERVFLHFTVSLLFTQFQFDFGFVPVK